MAFVCIEIGLASTERH